MSILKLEHGLLEILVLSLSLSLSALGLCHLEGVLE